MQTSHGAKQASREEKKEKKGAENEGAEKKGDAKKEGGKKVCLATLLLKVCVLLWFVALRERC